jgi:GDP-4-dehydro-6-deoxy-D-mannose reductase
MKALITGAAGFVGNHLISHLRSLNWDVFATRLPHEHIDTSISVHELNILNPIAVNNLLEQIQPDYIFHLAAQSSVALSWQEPVLTADVNIKGTIHLLETIRNMKNPPRILLIGSGEEYGYVLQQELPIREDTQLRPGNIYAGTKAAQGLFGQIYARAYSLKIVVARAFNHIGPGQLDTFSVSNFCRQTAEIEAGIRPPVIKTGNLSARRDFTDVRDIVKAYSLLIQEGKSGEIYNVGSGKVISMREVLDLIVSLSTVKISVEQDATRLRPSDTPVIEADISRLVELTGWTPEISLQNSLIDSLQYWRTRVRM